MGKIINSILGAGLLCGLILTSGCYYSPKDKNFTQRGVSMEPTLKNNTSVRIATDYSVIESLKRGDMVLFKYPGNPEFTFIKRIVALPGETIEILDGRVYINGVLLNEPYIDSQITTFGMKSAMKDEEYFVMGDNRSNSSDSRAWGPVPKDLIIGKVVI